MSNSKVAGAGVTLCASGPGRDDLSSDSHLQDFLIVATSLCDWKDQGRTRRPGAKGGMS